VRDDKRNLRVRDGDLTNIDIIDENETWAEVSKIIPSLPYGEESNELLLVLLGLDYSSVGGNDNHSDATNSEDESISQIQSQYYALSNLARALERMLHARNNAPRQKRLRNSDQSLKQKPINEEHPQVMTERTSTEILPWNVLLRITIRMVSFVANKLLQSSLSIKNGTLPERDFDGSIERICVSERKRHGFHIMDKIREVAECRMLSVRYRW
jgi:hypothetical protein